MNIFIITITFTVAGLIIANINDRKEIKRLRNELEVKRRKTNEFVVDSENKIITLHLKNSEITPDVLDMIYSNVRVLKTKGYDVIILDKYTDIRQTIYSKHLVAKCKDKF